MRRIILPGRSATPVLSIRILDAYVPLREDLVRTARKCYTGNTSRIQCCIIKNIARIVRTDVRNEQIFATILSIRTHFRYIILQIKFNRHKFQFIFGFVSVFYKIPLIFGLSGCTIYLPVEQKWIKV